jgi:carboxylesterase family protein
MPDREAGWHAARRGPVRRISHRLRGPGILTGRGFAILTAIGLVAMAGCSASASAPSPSRHVGLVVSIADGQIRGKDAGSTDDYLGIPYAAAPEGPLRWRPPQPPARWHGTRAAT